ncbi:MAG: A/G-specific adenine glycosylase [Dehalococcoidia bacterium]|nr:A/G-specific adenine glycosylase [Dehalococcoidia bacterium]
MGLRSASAPQAAAIQRALLRWAKTSGRDLPWRRTRDPYAVLLSEVMLQQTQVSRVLPKYHEFLQAYPTVRHLAAAPLSDVVRRWAPLGYNLRAVRLHRAARAVVDEHGGRVPSCTDELRSLPGLGAYSAAAVTCFAFKAQVPVVDTNVGRVLRRVFGGTPLPREVAQLAQRLLPSGRAREWNLALMDLGATVCTARAPQCSVCPLQTWCAFVTGDGALREARASYRVAKAPFVGSRRYFRGRVVEALRHAGDEGLDVRALGPLVKDGFADGDAAWLRALLAELAGDGLVTLHHPSRAEASQPLRVSLPGP